jgi:hypothetical protein
VRQNQSKVVMSPPVVGRNGNGLPEIPFRLLPLPLEIETVSHVAKDVRIPGAGLDRLLILVLRLPVGSLERQDVGQVKMRITPRLVPLERCLECSLGLIEIPLALSDPRESDLDVGLLRRRNFLAATVLGPAYF